MNKFQSKSYTLIELVMAISLLVLVLAGGTAIFYRSFRSSGVSDVQTVVDNGIGTLDEMIEQSLRYGKVIRVAESVGGGSYLRADCLSSPTGVSGDSLVVRDIYGGDAIYSLSDGKVSSNSSVIISSPEIVVTKLRFTWVCRSGVNDKMNLLIEATASAVSGEGAQGSLSKDITLLNSGVY